MLSEAPENALAESESTLQSSRGGWEHLEVLRSTGDGYRSVWEVCVWLPDWITFCWCKGQYTGARLATHLKEVLDHLELTAGHLLRIMSNNASSNCSMTWELQSTFEVSGIKLAAMSNYIPWMAHGIQLVLGAFMSSLCVKCCTKSWEAHESNQPFGENGSTAIGKSQWLQNEGNSRINEVLAMRPGLAKIIEKVHNWGHFEWP